MNTVKNTISHPRIGHVCGNVLKHCNETAFIGRIPESDYSKDHLFLLTWHGIVDAEAPCNTWSYFDDVFDVSHYVDVTITVNPINQTPKSPT